MSTPSPASGGDGPATVLVLDDEEMVSTALRSFLELATDYRVLTFADPHAALRAVDEEPVSVLVSDFMMPGMDGISFLKEARERRPHATRILLTGYADKQNAIRAINEAGLYYYLEKPWSNAHLGMVVRNAVERAQLFRELEALLEEVDSARGELDTIRQRLIRTFL
jgi:putative two-component system response regulator